MTNLVFEKRGEITVKIYGDVFQIRKPTMKEIEALSSVNLEKEKDASKKFLANLGLPVDVLDGMDFDHYIALCEGIVSPKKKLS